MKKFTSCLILFSFVLNQSILFSPALAANNALKIKSADGSGTVYGSVLKPSENRLKVKIPTSLLKAIRSQGIDNLTVSITKIATEGQESSVYSIPSENLTLIGKQLLIDLLPCLDTAGSTVTAGALSNGSYSFQISAGSSQFSGSFDYKAPAVVVGSVDTGSAGCGGGTNTINSLSGNAISGAVALSSNCTFFNEVQAARAAKSKPGKGGKKHRSLFQEDASVPAAEDAFVYVDPVTDTEQTVAEVENVVVIEDEATGESDVVEISAPVDLEEEAGGDTEVVVDAGSTQEYDNAVADADTNNNGEIDTPAEAQALENDLSDNTSSTSSSGSTSSGAPNNAQLKPIQDPKAICERLREGIGKLKDCKGSDCPKPPCFPDDLRAKLKEVCAELIALIPEVKCERPQAVCGLQGGQSQQPGQPPAGGTSGQTPPPPGNTSGQILAAQFTPSDNPLENTSGQPPTGGTSGQPPVGGPGQPNAGPGPNDGQCQDFRPPQQPSICKLCNTAGPEGCTGPELKTVTASDGSTMCILPEVQCIPFTSLGKTSPDAKFDGICLFGDGDLTVGEEDDKPKDPTTCKPFQFDPGLACPQFRPTCDIQSLTSAEALKAFDPVCCKLPPQGQPGGQPPTGGTQPTNPGIQFNPPPARLNTDQVQGNNSGCLRDKYCGLINSGTTPTDEDLAKLVKSCTPGGGQNPPPCDPSKDPNCKPPTGGTSGQIPCDPSKDPNCKPPTDGGTVCPTGQVKDPATGQCKPADGGTLPPPCDPATDPNCKPPTDGGTACPTGQVKDPATGQCKPADGGTACPTGQVKDPATGQCKPADGGTACPTGQVKDPATGQCKPADGGTACPTGQVKDPATGQCKPADGGTACPTGQVKDPATGQCKPADGGTQPTTCPQGQIKCSDGSCKTTCP